MFCLQSANIIIEYQNMFIKTKIYNTLNGPKNGWVQLMCEVK